MNHNDENKKITALLYWLSSTMFDWGILITSFTCLYIVIKFSIKEDQTLWYLFSFVVFVVSWIVFGARQHALAIMAHDGAHGLICRNLKLNDFLTKVLTLLPFGMSLTHFRDFHFSHHKNLGTELDPELFLKKGTDGSYDLPNRGVRTIAAQSLRSLFGFSLPEIIDIIKHSGAPRTFIEFLEIALFYSLLLIIVVCTKSFFIVSFVVFWFFCLCTSFFMFFKLRIFTEHVGTKEAHRIERSLLTSFFICPHNTWCHYEHHALPSITSRDLPSLRNKLFSNHKTIYAGKLYEAYKTYPNVISGIPFADEKSKI